jgi:hypothetical protein
VRFKVVALVAFSALSAAWLGCSPADAVATPGVPSSGELELESGWVSVDSNWYQDQFELAVDDDVEVRAEWTPEGPLEIRVRSSSAFSGISLSFRVKVDGTAMSEGHVEGQWRRDSVRVGQPREGPIEDASGLLRYRLESLPDRQTLVALYYVRCKVRGDSELVMGGWILELPPR